MDVHISFYCVLILLTFSKGQEEEESSRESEIETKIYGGVNAKKGEFPFAVSLQDLSILPNKSLGFVDTCGGVILSRRLILTAAHCTAKVSRVMAGRTHLEKGDAQFINVKSFKNHPKFNAKTLSYDIGILELSEQLKYTTRYVRPYLALPTQGREPAGKCTTIGWGMIRLYKQVYAKNLKKVELRILERDLCLKSAESVGQPNKYTFDESMFCSHEIGLGQLPGDSGSAVICQDNEKNEYLCGINSWGTFTCNDAPCTVVNDIVSVFAHVGNSYCWIREIMLQYPDTPNPQQPKDASVSVETDIKTPSKKICSKGNITHHISSKQGRACQVWGELCNQDDDCCTDEPSFCRYVLFRGKICTFDKVDASGSIPANGDFSIVTFLNNQFLKYDGWVGAAQWEIGSDFFSAFSDAFGVQLSELNNLQSFIADPITCCLELLYKLERRTQTCLRIEKNMVQLLGRNDRVSFVFKTTKEMLVLITKGLSRHLAWDLVASWQDVLIRHGR